MRRWIFNFATAISLLLCAGTVALWAASARDGKKVHWARRDGRHVFIGCIQSHACISVTKPWPCDETLASDDSEPFALLTGPLIEWRHLYVYGWSGSGFVAVGRDGKVPNLPHGGGATNSQTFGPEMPPGSSTRPITGWHVGIPMWMLVGLTLLVPIVRFSDLGFAACRQRQRKRHGLCPDCSYDLKGNLSGICPECGNSVAEKAVKA